MPVSDHLVQQVVLMMIPIGRIVSSTRGLAIDGDCDGSDVWPHSGAIPCHHRTTPIVVVGRQVTADPVISSQVSHPTDSP